MRLNERNVSHFILIGLAHYRVEVGRQLFLQEFEMTEREISSASKTADGGRQSQNNLGFKFKKFNSPKWFSKSRALICYNAIGSTGHNSTRAPVSGPDRLMGNGFSAESFTSRPIQPRVVRIENAASMNAPIKPPPPSGHAGHISDAVAHVRL